MTTNAEKSHADGGTIIQITELAARVSMAQSLDRLADAADHWRELERAVLKATRATRPPNPNDFR